MDDPRRAIALRRLRALALQRADDARAPMSRKHRLTLLAELAQRGYRPSNPELLERAAALDEERYGAVIAELESMRGGGVDYAPLFRGFPDDVPDDDAYFARRIVGLVGNLLELFGRDGDGSAAADSAHVATLENGMRVPSWLFDLSEFGADPITQMQTPELFEAARAEQADRDLDTTVAWIELELCFDDALDEKLRVWLLKNLYAKSSIKQVLRADLVALLDAYGAATIDPESVVMREARALVAERLLRAGDIAAGSPVREAVAHNFGALVKTPTDLLRLFAAMTESDISLARPITFPKLTRAQRRVVLGVLEAAPALEEDLVRYRGLWLAVGRSLHVGEHARRFPKAAAAFDKLRNGRIVTFESRAEKLIADGDVPGVLAHLAHRPALLGRRLHELLRRFGADSGAAILEAFDGAASEIPLKNLLTLQSYLATINEADARAVVNKKGKLKVLANSTKGALDGALLAEARGRVDAAVLARIAADKSTWAQKRVWVDPALEHYTVPLQQRAASDGVLCVGRGSRMPVELGKVLRLFVYWKERGVRTDLDLSVMKLDADYNYKGHVSFTNLEDGGVVHSGDLQSAPHGAAEFIDIPLAVLEPDVRYVAAEVLCYSGARFNAIDCHAGWMVRDKVDKRYASFDIKTVQHKFDLHGEAAYCIPLIVDVKAQQVIFSDLYVAGSALNTIEGSYTGLRAVCEALVDFTRTRPTVAALARQHARARGATLCEEREQADVTFGLAGCTYNVYEVETLLSELL